MCLVRWIKVRHWCDGVGERWVGFVVNYLYLPLLFPFLDSKLKGQRAYPLKLFPNFHFSSICTNLLDFIIIKILFNLKYLKNKNFSL